MNKLEVTKFDLVLKSMCCSFRWHRFSVKPHMAAIQFSVILLQGIQNLIQVTGTRMAQIHTHRQNTHMYKIKIYKSSFILLSFLSHTLYPSYSLPLYVPFKEIEQAVCWYWLLTWLVKFPVWFIRNFLNSLSFADIATFSL